MRLDLMMAVREAFERLLRHGLPDFHPVTNDELPGECHLYACEVAEGIAFYVMLQFQTHEDSFTIEIAWGAPGRYPTIAAFMAGRVDVGEASRRKAGRLRLGSLWAGREVWWDVGPGRRTGILRRVFGDDEAVRVVEQVEDAWAHLTREGMACLRAVAHRVGVDLPGARTRRAGA